MSAIPPKADIDRRECHVCFVPKADIVQCASLAISAPQPPQCMIAAGFAGVLRMFRLAVADLDSPSYFVATAAVELGYFKDEGIDVELERIYGAHVGPERLRDGTLLRRPGLCRDRRVP